MDKLLNMEMNTLVWAASFLTVVLFFSICVSLREVVMQKKEEDKSRRTKQQWIFLILLISFFAIVAAIPHATILGSQIPNYTNFNRTFNSWIHCLAWAYVFWLFGFSFFRIFKSKLKPIDKESLIRIRWTKYLLPTVICIANIGIGLFLIYIAAHLPEISYPIDSEAFKLADSLILAGILIWVLGFLHVYASRKVLKFKQAKEGVIQSRRTHFC